MSRSCWFSWVFILELLVIVDCMIRSSCCLCLLGGDGKRIHMNYSTKVSKIWEEEKKKKKRFLRCWFFFLFCLTFWDERFSLFHLIITIVLALFLFNLVFTADTFFGIRFLEFRTIYIYIYTHTHTHRDR